MVERIQRGRVSAGADVVFNWSSSSTIRRMQTLRLRSSGNTNLDVSMSLVLTHIENWKLTYGS